MRTSRRAEQGSEFVSDPANTDAAQPARLLGFKRHDWVVVAKTPLAGLEVVLDHLSRYTQRVAVSNERIVGIDAKGVRLRVRADDQGGKRSIVIDSATMPAASSQGREYAAAFRQRTPALACHEVGCSAKTCHGVCKCRASGWGRPSATPMTQRCLP